MMNDKTVLESVNETAWDRNENGSQELSVDRKFKLLKNGRRREIIDFLSKNDGPTTRSELAEIIAAEENGISVSELASNQRKRVYVSLYQTHLPTLARDDVVEYDANRGTVEPGPNMDDLVSYLQPTGDIRTDERNPFYVGLGVFGGVAYGLIRVAEVSIPLLVDLWAAGFVAALLLVSLYSTWNRSDER